MIRGVIYLLLLATFAAEAGTPDLDKAVAAFVLEMTGTRNVPRYHWTPADLNGDAKSDAVVLLSNDKWCGSGGCTLLIFEGTNDGFGFVSHSTVTREPIFVLSEVRLGWHTLSVLVSGGGILEGYQALLRFDGTEYPLNPSMQERAVPAELKGAKQLKLK